VNSPDWDDDAIIASWCEQQRIVAAEYLARQPVEFGELGDWPAWHVAPYVAVWAVESVKAPGKVGWWVISGDLPTDYASGGGVPDPRAAVAVFSERWAHAADAMERGEPPQDIIVGSPENASQLWPLLRKRAQILDAWIRDESVWENG
jgi:hypothetical protein